MTVDDHEKELLHYWLTDVVGEQLNASEDGSEASMLRTSKAREVSFTLVTVRDK